MTGLVIVRIQMWVLHIHWRFLFGRGVEEEGGFLCETNEVGL